MGWIQAASPPPSADRFLKTYDLRGPQRQKEVGTCSFGQLQMWCTVLEKYKLLANITFGVTSHTDPGFLVSVDTHRLLFHVEVIILSRAAALFGSCTIPGCFAGFFYIFIIWLHCLLLWLMGS